MDSPYLLEGRKTFGGRCSSAMDGGRGVPALRCARDRGGINPHLSRLPDRDPRGLRTDPVASIAARVAPALEPRRAPHGNRWRRVPRILWRLPLPPREGHAVSAAPAKATRDDGSLRSCAKPDHRVLGRALGWDWHVAELGGNLPPACTRLFRDPRVPGLS